MLSPDKTMQSRVLRCLEGGAERTCYDIAEIIGEPIGSVAGRLAELARSQRVERAGAGPRQGGARNGRRPILWKIKVPKEETP